MKKNKKSEYEIVQDYVRYLKLELEHFENKLSELDAPEEKDPIAIYRIQAFDEDSIFVELANSSKKGFLYYSDMDYEFKKRNRSLSKFSHAFVSIDKTHLCWYIPVCRGSHIFRLSGDQLDQILSGK